MGNLARNGATIWLGEPRKGRTEFVLEQMRCELDRNWKFIAEDHENAVETWHKPRTIAAMAKSLDTILQVAVRGSDIPRPVKSKHGLLFGAGTADRIHEWMDEY